MVKVQYGEPYRTSFGETEERIKANTLGSLLEKIEKKYGGKKHANEVSKYSLILLNEKEFLNIKELEYKLKPKDEVIIMQMLSGG